jgi:hypothetical protein
LDLQAWPSREVLGLDPSQYAALQTAMTKEFVTIQGPPGTGKTYVGLKIVQLLLKNSDYWEADQSPILVVCFTNHALDQFLEGIIDMCKLSPGQLVRVGGRSSSENKTLQACGLFDVKKRESEEHRYWNMHNAVRDVREQMSQTQSEITVLVAQMECARKSVLHESHLQHLMTESQCSTLYSRPYAPGNHSLFPEWLCFNEFNLHNMNADEKNEQDGTQPEEFVIEDDEDEVMRLEQERHLEDTGMLTQRQQHLKHIKEASEAFQQHCGLADKTTECTPGDEGDEEDTGGQWQKARKSKKNKGGNAVRHNLRRFKAMTEEESLAVRNVWCLPIVDRWRLYSYWASCYCEEKSILIRNLCVQYNGLANHLTEVSSEEDYQVLRKALVVGMTTTGAAKYRQLLQRVHPKIVIVEEAAEVLEAHVVTTLTSRCEHLILIGDHQQLRPNPTVYKLAKQYHLDISLFERMVKNNLHCDRLTIQHRMRPEIVKLIVPHVYKSLDNHKSVLEYENIRGISGNLFFISHTEVERRVEDTRSRSNHHEASFLASLCHYLIQQGYKPTQITVLTMYTGQMFLLRRLMPKTQFEGVRITPVDNYQGEENDIILLSLVRSNEEGKIGFLQIHNRVCVALSRAKKGLYVIGNMELMADASNLWNGITKELKTHGQLVDALPLACQNHPENVINVKCDKDFQNVPEGGCMQDCGYRLPCGHVCQRKCHPTDKLHEEYICQKPCTKIVCESGHHCTKLCHQPCGNCEVFVEKTIPSCGHIQKMKCHKQPGTFVCQVRCENMLICGHHCQNTCGEPCSTECSVIVPDREWPCGHKLTVACHKKPYLYPCHMTVTRRLVCGHEVEMKCSDDIVLFKCTVKVTFKLCDDIAHTHETVCHRLTEEKTKKCQKTVNVVCSREPKHKYVTKCCDRQLGSCPLVCNSTLPCGHRCDGICGTCADSDTHKPCRAKCQKLLGCGHRCTANCAESCPPCRDACLLHCGHNQCRQLCGAVCDVCTRPCLWRCLHQTCQLLCHEPCTRPPCDEPCMHQLRCRHPCIGLCGEPCPPWCGICHEKNISQVVRFLKVKNFSVKSTKFVHLKPCGHVVEVDYMDDWVRTNAPQPPCEPQPVTCPICKKLVGFCPRYNSNIKLYMLNINAVKKASATSSRLTFIIDRAIASFWPSSIHSMKQLLLERAATQPKISAVDGARPGLVLGAVCTWQECWNLLQVCQRKEYQRPVNVDDKATFLEKSKLELLEAFDSIDSDRVMKIVLQLHLVYLLLHVRRLTNFIKNPRYQRLLTSLAATPYQTAAKITQIIHINQELESNFSLMQRDNIANYLKHLNQFFQPTLKDKLHERKWLVCGKGHAFGVSVDVVNPTCDQCRPDQHLALNQKLSDTDVDGDDEIDILNVISVNVPSASSKVSHVLPRLPLVSWKFLTAGLHDEEDLLLDY